MQVTVAGQQISVEAGATIADAFKQALSKKQFKEVVAANCGGTTLDLSLPAAEGQAGAGPGQAASFSSGTKSCWA